MSTSSAGDIDPNWSRVVVDVGVGIVHAVRARRVHEQVGVDRLREGGGDRVGSLSGVTPPITDTSRGGGRRPPRRTRRRREVRAAGERGDKQAGVEPGRPDAQLVEFDLVGAQFARRLDVLARDAAPPTTTPTSQPSAASRSIASAYAATRSGSRSGASTLPPIETTTLITVEYPCRGLKDYQAGQAETAVQANVCSDTGGTARTAVVDPDRAGKRLSRSQSAFEYATDIDRRPRSDRPRGDARRPARWASGGRRLRWGGRRTRRSPGRAAESEVTDGGVAVRRDDSDDEGAAERAADTAIALDADGSWAGRGRVEGLDDLLDGLAPDHDYLVAVGESRLRVPTVLLGADAEPADVPGSVVAAADAPDQIDLDGLVTDLADAEPWVTREALVRQVEASADADRAGAIATFTGRVRARDAPNDDRTTHLAFEKYEGSLRSRWTPSPPS